jgi:hypothetical protein
MYAKRLQLNRSFDLCISLMDELKLPAIAGELRKLKEIKETQAVVGDTTTKICYHIPIWY